MEKNSKLINVGPTFIAESRVSLLMLIFNLGVVLVNRCKNLIVTHMQGGPLMMGSFATCCAANF